MTKITRFALFCSILLISSFSTAQIRIKPLINHPLEIDSAFVMSSSPRLIKLLDSKWRVFSSGKETGAINTTIPFIFEGAESLILEKELYFSQTEIENSVFKLHFAGINYFVEISLNGYNIFKKSGGEIPFEMDLPEDIIKSDLPNKLQIKIDTQLNSDESIPVNQRFLFPRNTKGILRNIYLEILPKMHISSFKMDYSIDPTLSSARGELSVTLKNLNLIAQETLNKGGMELKLQLIPKNFSGSTYSYDLQVPANNGGETSFQQSVSISAPVLWSNETPNVYTATLTLLNNNQVIDKAEKELSFFRIDFLKNNTTLNNTPFKFKGITYLANEDELSRTGNFERLQRDLKFIKESGFNSVRFSKVYPNPYAIELCQEFGLFAFVELPLNSIPEEILKNQEFQLRAANRLRELIETYSHKSSPVIFGLGSSYLSNSFITGNFLEKIINGKRSSYYYASFLGIQEEKIEGLNLAGIELYSTHPDIVENILKNISEMDNSNTYFFSEVNYPNYYGGSGGYLVKNSTESQAKYFDRIVELSLQSKSSGFFINTLFNYSGDFVSLYSGYSDEAKYKLGIFNENPNPNNLVYKVLSSRLNNKSKVTIPIGSVKDENKLLFILIALGLSIVMALLINTRKKFREDCSRALFRPYNFFADIRDRRIISGLHTFILLLVEAGSISLLFTILFYYLRTNLLAEKILLSFGEPYILQSFSYAAWNPEKSFLIMFFVIIIKILLIGIFVKAASLLIKTKVQFSSIFFMIVWSILPFTILLPVELILYKILTAGGFNSIVLLFIILFWLWVFQRLLKGIHILFDVRRFAVYFYGLILFVVIIGGTLIYFQLSSSTIYYITNSIKQYNLISF